MRDKVIERWMLLLMAMLLMACGGSEEENSSIPEDEDCYLDIYVYAPDRPIVTRGDVGEIEIRAKEESEVHTLQIWVFKSSNGDPVGYLNAGGDDEAYNDTGAKIPDPSILNETGQQIYRMKVEKSFANNPEAVDVYVVANAASCGLTGLTALGKTTSRADLNNAKIGEINNVDYFGTTDLYGIDDLATGLPMSAVLKNQPISGKFPALRIGSESQIATLHLTRAVSKLRFVLCRITESENATKKLKSIDDISLDANMIPTQTYLVPREAYTYTYDHDAISYGGVATSAIPEVPDPQVYAYEGQNETMSAQAYEDKIEAAISQNYLIECGLTYFRESDKQLTGTIRYTNIDETTAEAKFVMAAPGDFLRNHSWIIYIYYLDSKIYTLTVTNIGMKKWVTDPLDEKAEVYNW